MLWKHVDFCTEVFFCFCLQLVFILEQLHAITSVTPETPHEKWFQEKFGKCHSRILYPVRRETVTKFLLVQKASWAVELLSLSRNIPLFGQPNFACTETDHRSPSSANSFMHIYPQFISYIFCNIISLSTGFHLPDFVITPRCHNRNVDCGLHMSYPCHPFCSVFLKILIEEFSC